MEHESCPSCGTRLLVLTRNQSSMATPLWVRWGAGLVNSGWPRPPPVEATYQTITIKCRGNDGSAAAAVGAAEERESIFVWAEQQQQLPCAPPPPSTHLSDKNTILCEGKGRTDPPPHSSLAAAGFFFLLSSSSFFFFFFFSFFHPSLPPCLSLFSLPDWNNQSPSPRSLRPCVGSLDAAQVNAHLLHTDDLMHGGN